MTRTRVLIVLIMLLMLAALIWFGFSAYTHKDQPSRYGSADGANRVSVLVARATRADVPVILRGVGTIQAYQTVTVQPQVGGKLLSLNFKDGQTVEKGQVLARIDPTTYKADLEQARARLAMDQAALVNARLDLKRYAKLARTNYVSKQQADQARATVRQDKAQVESDKAAVDSAQATLDYTAVAAPISGRTGIRRVDEGNIVDPGNTDGIVVITQLRPISAVFTLPAVDVARVRAAAAKGPLSVRVLGANGDSVLDAGQLEVINNQVDTTTGTIKLKAVLPNAEEQLWPGQFVNVQLRIGTRDNATVVPIAAVQQGPRGAFVYGIDNNDKAEMRAVQVAQQDENRAVISQGVTPGERVITAGFAQLSDGARVGIGSASDDNAKPSRSDSTAATTEASATEHQPEPGRADDGAKPETGPSDDRQDDTGKP